MQFSEDLIDIKIECCGICGSDAHTVTNGWPSPTPYPVMYVALPHLGVAGFSPSRGSVPVSLPTPLA